MDAFSDIRPVPLDVILSWPKPNYVDPERRGPALLAVNCVLLPLALIVVGLRLYTRLVVVRSAGLDDLFIGFASIVAVGLTIAVCLAASNYGWDLHIWDVPDADIIPSRQTTFVAQFFFVMATNLTRMSILLFYRRLLTPGIRKALDYAVWATLAFVTSYTLAFGIALITTCSPVKAFWDISVPHHCNNQRKFEMAAAIINIISDFVVIFIPLPTVWGLKLPMRQKWALSGVFMMGFFVCIVGTVRVYYVNIIVNETFDTTWEGFILWIFVAVEVDVGLICASAPTLKPLFKRYFNSSKAYGSHRGFQKHSSNYPGSNNLETGILVPPSVELVHVAHAGKSKTSPILPGDNRDSESEESVFALQGGNVSALPRDGRKMGSALRCPASKCTWGRKEP